MIPVTIAMIALATGIRLLTSPCTVSTCFLSCGPLEMARPVTVAALHGGVYGGATDLALACDFRVGAHGIDMFMPAARLGLHYYRSGLERYVSRLGLDNAKRLFLTEIGRAHV